MNIQTAIKPHINAIAWGILIIIFAIWMTDVGEWVNRLHFFGKTQKTTGYVIATDEYDFPGEHGELSIRYYVKYTYTTQQGNTFTNVISGTGRIESYFKETEIGDPVPVEYSKYNSSISRLVNSSRFDDLLISLIPLITLWYFGCYLIKSGIKDHINLRGTLLEHIDHRVFRNAIFHGIGLWLAKALVIISGFRKRGQKAEVRGQERHRRDGGAAERGFLLHWGGAKTKGLFFVLARRCRPLADRSPARVGFNAPSSKNSRLIFAQQPRPNDKRNPLHHVLRTAGTAGRLREGP